MSGRARWRNLGLLAVSTVGALALGEVAVRRLLPPPPSIEGAGWIHDNALSGRRHVPDSVIGWVLSQDTVESRHRSVAADSTVIFDVTYSLGGGQRRTSDRGHAGPVVICTGGSFTFGHGLPDRETWPWLLQERLPDTRVVNVGSMAYGTDQSLLAAERQVERYGDSSRVVVLGFVDFHVGRNQNGPGWLIHLLPFGKPHYVLDGDGVQYRGLVRFYDPGPLLRKSELLTHLLNDLARIRRRTPTREQARELTARLIIESAARLETKGVRLLVVVLPWHTDVEEEAVLDRTRVLDRLAEAGIEVLVPEFPRGSDGKLDTETFWISRQDRHPNLTYNTVLADRIAAVLAPDLP